jgi:5-hydroxyisourate hydrolase-like protein (transthyretin family)
VPGTQVAVSGSGYAPGAKIAVSVAVKLTNGQTQTLSAAATANASGRFTTALRIPANAAGGTYTVVGRSENGRAPTARLVIAKLAPSIVSVPAMAAPGTQVTVNGFGFAPGQTITVSLQGQKVGTAATDAAGRFSLKVTIPSNTASGTYTLSAVSAAGRGANLTLTVNRVVSTHYYFASEYTGAGYHEYLALLNPTQIRARITITYQRTNGSTLVKSLMLNAHTRSTEDVNADLGIHVSAAAEVAADVPIVASRQVYHGTDTAIAPGATTPSATWYFANGNTGKGYREYIAIQNPNSTPVQVAVHFLPAHHRAFTVNKIMPATSRTTFKVNSYVRKDAVGVTVTANGPVVANRTIFVHHGMTSKIGAAHPMQRWYFAAGPQNPAARHWIGAINPTSHWSYLTLHAYGPLGSEVATVHGWLKPYARAGYLINKIARRTDVAVVLTASRAIVAEQTTYAGRMHNASTDVFGVAAPAKTWSFPIADTLSSLGAGDVLNLFNPNLAPAPIVVQFMTSSGQVVQRTYVVAPLAHQRIDVASVVPNAQLGIVAASNYPFVALNRSTIDNGRGADTSEGIRS